MTKTEYAVLIMQVRNHFSKEVALLRSGGQCGGFRPYTAAFIQCLPRPRVCPTEQTTSYWPSPARSNASARSCWKAERVIGDEEQSAFARAAERWTHINHVSF